jgi:hypothetical protein
MQEQPKDNKFWIIAVTALSTIVAFLLGLFGLMFWDSKPSANKSIIVVNANNANYTNLQPNGFSKSPAPVNQTITKSTPQSVPTIKPEPTKQVDLKIKGNKNSMIYHLPGCASYDRIADRNIIWFKTTEEAEAAGYRMAKNC